MSEVNNSLIWILIDHDYFPSKIVGVYPSYKEAVEAEEPDELPESRGQEIVAWNIVSNEQFMYGGESFST